MKNLSLSRCSTGWPLKMCKYQGQKRCLQRYWYSFLLPWRCKYFQNTLLTIFGFKITIFIPKWLFRGVNWIKSVKMSDFDPKKVITIFEIICIFTAAKNYTNNFADLYWPWYLHIFKGNPILHLDIDRFFNVFFKYLKYRLIFYSFHSIFSWIFFKFKLLNIKMYMYQYHFASN